jgi:hypothetical protein
VWDLSPGYLNRQSLLGEHRELHGIHAILANGKTGYSRHPETLRWVDARAGLALRHAQLVAEMRLRGYVDRTPVGTPDGSRRWPRTFVTEPWDQVLLLRRKYKGKAAGRIQLPCDAMQLWSQHAYSVLARSTDTHRSLRRTVARVRPDSMPELARELVLVLRERPRRRSLESAIERMWSDVRVHATIEERACVKSGAEQMLACTQAVALRTRNHDLLSSTALSELAIFLERGRTA